MRNLWLVGVKAVVEEPLAVRHEMVKIPKYIVLTDSRIPSFNTFNEAIDRVLDRRAWSFGWTWCSGLVWRIVLSFIECCQVHSCREGSWYGRA
jgi:hypothetical protein